MFQHTQLRVVFRHDQHFDQPKHKFQNQNQKSNSKIQMKCNWPVKERKNLLGLNWEYFP